jgi:hypothetical protein
MALMGIIRRFEEVTSRRDLVLGWKWSDPALLKRTQSWPRLKMREDQDYRSCGTATFLRMPKCVRLKAIPSGGISRV